MDLCQFSRGARLPLAPKNVSQFKQELDTFSLRREKLKIEKWIVDTVRGFIYLIYYRLIVEIHIDPAKYRPCLEVSNLRFGRVYMNLRRRSGLEDAFLISCTCRIQRFYELPGTNSLPGCWSSRWGHLTLTTWSFHFHPDNHLLVLPSIPISEFGCIFSFSFFSENQPVAESPKWNPEVLQEYFQP